MIVVGQVGVSAAKWEGHFFQSGGGAFFEDLEAWDAVLQRGMISPGRIGGRVVGVRASNREIVGEIVGGSAWDGRMIFHVRGMIFQRLRFGG